MERVRPLPPTQHKPLYPFSGARSRARWPPSCGDDDVHTSVSNSCLQGSSMKSESRDELSPREPEVSLKGRPFMSFMTCEVLTGRPRSYFLSAYEEIKVCTAILCKFGTQENLRTQDFKSCYISKRYINGSCLVEFISLGLGFEGKTSTTLCNLS